ncbi:MAG: hypothetical protein JWM19_3607 [Actinomycetia bacterium]|nr:hypothetical protein [Actinomycetes bacterium]
MHRGSYRQAYLRQVDASREAYCARHAGHPDGLCASPTSMKRQRDRRVAREKIHGRHREDPVAKARWRLAHKLLCVSCNTALGIIERKLEMAQAYLDARKPRRVRDSGASVLPLAS